MNNKSILAASVLSALFAATAANAEGRAGNSTDYADNSTQSVEIQKVSIQTPAAPIHENTNR